METSLRRILGLVALLAGLVWGGMFGWAVNVPETPAREQVRTAAFIVMAAAGMIAAQSRRWEDDEEL